MNGEHEFQWLESQNTIWNYSNLTTLFLPNGVLEANPNLKTNPKTLQEAPRKKTRKFEEKWIKKAEKNRTRGSRVGQAKHGRA